MYILLKSRSKEKTQYIAISEEHKDRYAQVVKFSEVSKPKTSQLTKADCIVVKKYVKNVEYKFKEN